MHRVVRGRDAMAGEEFLGEGLAAFQLRSSGRRAEDAMAGGTEAVDHAGDQRAFRTDHGHRHALALDQREQPVDVASSDVDVRSEEHTSKLQSLMRISYAVFCLKKKILDTQYNKIITTYHNLHIIHE